MELQINNIDAIKMGVRMGDNFLSSLLTPTTLKDFIFNESPLKDGTEYLIPEEPKVAERELTLLFYIEGPTTSAHLSYYKAFVDLLNLGKVVLYVPILQQRFTLNYKQCVSYGMNSNLTFSKLSVRFVEPNPKNRT